MRLPVGTANLHVVSHHQVEGAEAVLEEGRRSFGRRPVVGVQEAIELQHHAAVAGGRVAVVATKKDHEHLNTNAVLVPRRFKVTDSSWHFGAEPYGTGLNHRPRTWHEVQFEPKRGKSAGRRCAILNAHLSVLAHDVHDTRATRQLPQPLRSHAEMAHTLAARAMQLVAAGVATVVTADGNVGNDWPFSLKAALERQGFVVERHYVDLVGWHPTQLRRRGDRTTMVPRARTRSDHEAFVVDLETR